MWEVEKVTILELLLLYIHIEMYSHIEMTNQKWLSIMSKSISHIKQAQSDLWAALYKIFWVEYKLSLAGKFKTRTLFQL